MFVVERVPAEAVQQRGFANICVANHQDLEEIVTAAHRRPAGTISSEQRPQTTAHEGPSTTI
jgi:hypothetical protein